MKVWNAVILHFVCGALVIGAFPLCASPLQAQEAGQTSATTGGTLNGEARLDNLPDSPGVSSSSQQRPDSLEARNTQSSSGSSQSSQPQAQTTTPQQKPVGTAAAESSNAGGISASQPAGVAIAPAKQRRVRTIVLRVGALAAGGVAIGTVAALSRATSSKPPGAH